MYCTIAACACKRYTAIVREMKYTVLALSVLIAVPAAAGTSDGYEQIKGAALKTVYFETLFIAEYQEFRDRTKTYNYTEYHDADGTTLYKEGSRVETGQWKLVGEDKICYKYPSSDTPNDVHCFFTFKSGKCYYQYHRTEMTVRGPRDYKIWNARGVRKGDGGACDAPVG